MCGIAGFWKHDGSMRDSEDFVRRMTTAIRHRGPDDEGHWVDKSAGIALGHRRLSILDLSAHGHQPMFSSSGRYVIIFNGEVYNFQELRKELDLVHWHGCSDTEAMLASIEAWGLESAIHRFVGMFAFALWDRDQRKLHLVRDRLGIKPLYYGWSGQTFIFGSELKAFTAHPEFQPEIDRDSVALFLRHNYVPGPYCIYKGVRKLQPGCILTIDSVSNRTPELTTFWSARQAAEQGLANPFPGNDDEAVEATHELLSDAVRLRMIADVPLGAFLSGGIDSSSVVALMQAQSSRPVKTFSIGFYEDEYNEAPFAAAVARHLGTDHTELYLTAEDAMAVIPKLPALYDEPFADSSQIPTFLVSQLAREHVTVSLSGDGGDEVFSGYNRYLLGERLWSQIRRTPLLVRTVLGKSLTLFSPESWDTILGRAAPILPKSIVMANPGMKAHKLAEILLTRSPESLYHGLISHWDSPTDVVRDSSEPPTTLTSPALWANLPNFVQRMMYLDTVTYLPDDILTKVDRASMGVSLEARVPLLDHRVVEFAWRLPLSMKLRNGQGKWLLRQILQKYLPETMMERPKMGFGVPIGTWLRGPLRDWGEALLDEKRIRAEGFFHPAPIREKWVEHLSGTRNWQYWLWNVLMFQVWLENANQAPFGHQFDRVAVGA